MGVVASAEGRPTKQSYDVYTVLSAQLERELSQMRRAFATGLPRINAVLRANGLAEIEPKAIE